MPEPTHILYSFLLVFAVVDGRDQIDFELQPLVDQALDLDHSSRRVIALEIFFHDFPNRVLVFHIDQEGIGAAVEIRGFSRQVKLKDRLFWREA